MTKIAPSILAADPLRMFDAVKLVKDTGCDELHFDVMDGHFVPNISFGPSLLAAIHKEFDLHCDVHLMISDPLKYVENFAKSGAGTITIHQEANDFLPCLRKLRELGVRVGASVKPGTSVETLREALPLLDRVLLMTVEPGFGGQGFLHGMLPKIARFREEIDRRGLSTVLQVDGGIDCTTAPLAVRAGAVDLVAGSSVFGKPDPAQAARALLEAAVQ